MTTASTTGAGGAGGAETLRGPRPIALTPTLSSQATLSLSRCSGSHAATLIGIIGIGIGIVVREARVET
eukprot:1974410-Rhodomonas_salina.1